MMQINGTDDRAADDRAKDDRATDDLTNDDLENHGEHDEDEAITPQHDDANMQDEDANIEASFADEAVQKPRRKYGKLALGFTALSALIIGGASGGGFVRYVMPVFSPAAPAIIAESQSFDLAPLEAQIQRLEEKNTGLETQLSDLKITQSGFQAFLEDVVENIETLEGQNLDVSALSSRLEGLEKASPSVPIDETLIARLEALQERGSPALDLSAVKARLSEIESELESESGYEITSEITSGLALDREKLATLSAEIADLSQTVSAIQDEMSVASLGLKSSVDNAALPNGGENTPLKMDSIEKPVLISPFPKQALLDALSAQAPKKSLLARTLDKHIQVKDPSSPAGIIDKIETDLTQGRIKLALKRFDSLPPNIRRAGRKWRKQFK